MSLLECIDRTTILGNIVRPKMTMLVPYRATSSQKVDEPFYDFTMLTFAYFDMCHSETGETEIIDAYGIRKNVCVCEGRGRGCGLRRYSSRIVI